MADSLAQAATVPGRERGGRASTLHLTVRSEKRAPRRMWSEVVLLRRQAMEASVSLSYSLALLGRWAEDAISFHTSYVRT